MDCYGLDGGLNEAAMRSLRASALFTFPAGTAAPVTCPHCGAVLRHVSETPCQQTSHPTPAPPGARQDQTPQP